MTFKRKKPEIAKDVEADVALNQMVEILKSDLEILSTFDHDEYSHGIMTAYAECLEAIQLYDKDGVLKLDFDIEKKYNIN